MKTTKTKTKTKIKSNDRMMRGQKYVRAFEEELLAWKSPHKAQALRFMQRVGGARKLFELLHAIRRWYSGQTMARLIHSCREHLRGAMDLEPRHAVGAYRGFKVPKDHPLASVEPGERIHLRVTRNHGFSSWSLDPKVVNRFSGGGKGKVGIVVELTSGDGCKPTLAPPKRTKAWFNALYSHAIGDSYRPTEDEYLLQGKRILVRVIRVKR